MLERVVELCEAFGKMVFRIKFIATFYLTSCLMVHPTVLRVLPKAGISNFFGYLSMIVLDLVVLLFEVIGRGFPTLFVLVNPKLIRLGQMSLHLSHLNVGSVVGVLFESRLVLPPFLGIAFANLELWDVPTEAKEVSLVLLIEAAQHFIFALNFDSCDGLPRASIANVAKASVFPIFDSARSKSVHPHELLEVQGLRVFLILTRLMKLILRGDRWISDILGTRLFGKILVDCTLISQISLQPCLPFIDCLYLLNGSDPRRAFLKGSRGFVQSVSSKPIELS
jgi:hypothetical protein